MPFGLPTMDLSPSALLRRDAHPAVQFVKYVLAGGLATAVDVVVFSAAAVWALPALTPDDPVVRLLGLSLPAVAESSRSFHYVCDKTFAFLIANFVAYVANVLWVFTPGRHSRAVEFALFYAVSGTSFVIGTGLGWGLIDWAGFPTSYAYAANGVVAVLINYACRKFVIFKS